jgi:FkbM family methyltransferase
MYVPLRRAVIRGHSRLRGASARLTSIMRKVYWGVRAAGIGDAIRGTARLSRLYLVRPERSEIALRSGPVLEFDFPSQLPSALVAFGDYIDPEFAFLREIARPRWTVADVGAAIGQFSLFAAKFPATIVHAFEPSGANVLALRRNIQRNGVADRVTIHQLALSNVDGTCIFETTQDTWVSHIVDTDVQNGEIVPVRTLSDEFRRSGLSHITILKINVAGYEPKVLEGAESFLAEGRASILILLLGLPSLPWYERIARLGYRFFYYHPVEKRLYEVKSFTERSVLDSRPWPARNIIGIHCSAIANGLISSLRVCDARPIQGFKAS